VAVLTLAVGIAANSAIFGVVNGVLLRPLPFRDADGLVNLWRARPAAGTNELPVSIPTIEDWKRQSRAFEDIGFYTVSNVPRHMFDWRNPPEDAPMVWHSTVSSNFFELLGTAPAAGRTFSAEDAAKSERVAVIAHSVWTSVFGAAPDIAGRMVTMGGLPYQIIGVMPAEFDFPTRRTGVWTPIEIDPSWPANRVRRDQALVNAIARLRPGTTVVAAQTEMTAFASNLGPTDERVSVGPVQVQLLGKSLPFTLFVLLGAVACVLLIACSNIANLLLARGAARSREMAVRTALGAGRFRLLRQMLTESTLLGLAGGILALPLALWGFNALKVLGAQSLPRLDQARLDTPVFAFTLAVSVLAGVLCGLVPAMRNSRQRIASRPGGWPRVLVAAQLALAVVSLAGGSLMIRSFLAVLAVDPGFSPHGVLTVELRRANRAPMVLRQGR
jgi:predicted permease